MLGFEGLETARAHQRDGAEDIPGNEFFGLQGAGGLARVVAELEDDLAVQFRQIISGNNPALESREDFCQ